MDVESRTAELSLRRGISADVEFGASVGLVWWGGGVLDSAIETWHKAFGLPKGDRPEVPKNQMSIDGVNRDGSRFRFSKRGTQLGNLDLSLKLAPSIIGLAGNSFSLEFLAGLPSGSGGLGRSGVDLGVELLSGRLYENYDLFWGISYLYYPDTEWENIGFASNRFSGFLALDYDFDRKWFFGGSLLVRSPLLESPRGFPSGELYVDFYLRRVITEHWALEVLIRENPYSPDSTADISAALSLLWRG